MKDSTYDQILVTLALLAPLAMFALSKWRASLDTWYVPMDAVDVSFSGKPLGEKVSAWLETSSRVGAELVVIADKNCPCTQVTLQKLHEALALSPRRDIHLVIRDIHDVRASQDAAWSQVLREVPSTPTLLAIDGKQLIYAGPVTSGNFCTAAVSRILGVTALQTPRANAVISFMDKGCYCRLSSA